MRNFSQMFHTQMVYYKPNCIESLRASSAGKLAYDTWLALNDVSYGAKLLYTTYGTRTGEASVAQGREDGHIVFADKYNAPILRLTVSLGGWLKRGRGSRLTSGLVYKAGPASVGGFYWSSEDIASTKPDYIVRKLATAFGYAKKAISENAAELKHSSATDFDRQMYRVLKPSFTPSNFNDVLRHGLVMLGEKLAKNLNAAVDEEYYLSTQARLWLVRIVKGDATLADAPVGAVSQIEGVWRKIEAARALAADAIRSAENMFSRPKWLMIAFDEGVYTVPVDDALRARMQRFLTEWARAPGKYHGVKLTEDTPRFFYQPRFDLSRMDDFNDAEVRSLESSLQAYRLFAGTEHPELVESAKVANWQNTQGLFLNDIGGITASPAGGWMMWSGNYSSRQRLLLIDRD
jgi:hypothetical protein